jgi:hypothetical protein
LAALLRYWGCCWLQVLLRHGLLQMLAAGERVLMLWQRLVCRLALSTLPRVG